MPGWMTKKRNILVRAYLPADLHFHQRASQRTQAIFLNFLITHEKSEEINVHVATNHLLVNSSWHIIKDFAVYNLSAKLLAPLESLEIPTIPGIVCPLNWRKSRSARARKLPSKNSRLRLFLFLELDTGSLKAGPRQTANSLPELVSSRRPTKKTYVVSSDWVNYP